MLILMKMRPSDNPVEVPYGVAIAIGALLTFPEGDMVVRALAVS